MEFIFIPLIVGICVAGFYGVFELLIRRRERLNIIEKLGDKVTPEMLGTRMACPQRPHSGLSFGAMKAAGLLMGVGLGLLLAFFIAHHYNLTSTGYDVSAYEVSRIREILYGASVLLFGGLGLLIAFIVEVKMRRKEK